MIKFGSGHILVNSLDGLEGEHLGEVVDQSFIGLTSWFNTRNQSKYMYKVHRNIDMKHVVTGIYKQNSSTLFFFFFFKMSDTLLSLK